MSTSSSVQTFSSIVAHATKNADDRPRRIPPMRPGEWSAQGDVNFIALPSIPKRAKPTSPISQLAPGHSRGSRHCISQDDINKVEFFAIPGQNALQGLILKMNGDVRIEHPEHGDHIYSGGAIVLVSYQRRYAEELRRVQD